MAPDAARVGQLAEALEDFNSLRWMAAADNEWTQRLDRLAQATFRAAEHLIVYGNLSPGGPNHWRLAGLLWLFYALYEVGMKQRWLCTGECTIRVDLLLIYPVLVIGLAAALVSLLRARTPGPRR
jgi:hypothetical protein